MSVDISTLKGEKSVWVPFFFFFFFFNSNPTQLNPWTPVFNSFFTVFKTMLPVSTLPLFNKQKIQKN